MVRFLLMLSILLISAGCGGQGMIPLHGKLIYASGGGIYEFDLATRKETILNKTHGRFTSLSALNVKKLLVDTAGEPPSSIQVLDRSTYGLNDLRLGGRPVYMPTHRKFFYFYGHLYLADLDKPTQSARKVAEGEFSYTHAIPISDNEIVFPIRGDAGKTPPYRYNLVTDTLEQLPFKRQCTPYVWRSASRQILCGVDGTSEYYLVSLDGQNITPVDLSGLPSKTPLPLLYIPKYDALILNVARTRWISSRAGEHFDLWAYSFKDGRSEELQEGNAPGRGGIVWVER